MRHDVNGFLDGYAEKTSAGVSGFHPLEGWKDIWGAAKSQANAALMRPAAAMWRAVPGAGGTSVWRDPMEWMRKKNVQATQKSLGEFISQNRGKIGMGVAGLGLLAAAPIAMFGMQNQAILNQLKKMQGMPQGGGQSGGMSKSPVPFAFRMSPEQRTQLSRQSAANYNQLFKRRTGGGSPLV